LKNYFEKIASRFKFSIMKPYLIFLALAILASMVSPKIIAEDSAEKQSESASIAKDSRCFELRIYYAAPGKFEELNARFRNYTNKLFQKHGMTIIGYWIPTDKDRKDQLIYLLAFPDRAARDKAFAEFSKDPEWQDVVKKTEANGRLVTRVESIFLKATDYSPIK